MELRTIHAETRELTGKEVARKLKQQGRIPGILYGPILKNAIPLAFDAREFSKVGGRRGGKQNILLNMILKGADGEKEFPVFVKDFQRDVISLAVYHVDFLAMDLNKKFIFEIPLQLVGKEAVAAAGGLPQLVSRTVRISCLPLDLPEFLDVDISAATMGTTILAGDIKLRDGLELKEEADNPLITIVSLMQMVEEEAPKEGAEEAAEEGAKTAEAAAK